MILSAWGSLLSINLLSLTTLVHCASISNGIHTKQKSASGLTYFELEQKDIKLKEDDKIYSTIKLENGAEIIIVSDPDTALGGLSLDLVGVGGSLDPKGLPGLSNLVHKLVSNWEDSVKYPALTTTDGTSSVHGSVTRDRTRFHVEFSNDKLSDTISDFAKLFIDRKFSPAIIEKQINHLEEEFKKLSSDDNIILRRIQQYLSDDELAPYDIFFQGNLKSLHTQPKESSVDVASEAEKFYQSQYSSNRMRFVIISNQEIDTIIETAVNGLSILPDHDLAPVPKITNPITDDYLGVLVNVVPRTDVKLLRFEFVIPKRYAQPYSWATDCLIKLLEGDEEHTLVDGLRMWEWITGLEGKVVEHFDDSVTLDFTFQATEEGLEERYNIMLKFFDVLHFIRDKVDHKKMYEEYIEDHASNIYEELLNKSGIELADYLLDLRTQRTLPIPSILKAPEQMHKFSVEDFKGFFDYLRPKNMRMFKMSLSVNDMEELEEEEWFLIKHRLLLYLSEVGNLIEKKLDLPFSMDRGVQILPFGNPQF